MSMADYANCYFALFGDFLEEDEIGCRKEGHRPSFYVCPEVEILPLHEARRGRCFRSGHGCRGTHTRVRVLCRSETQFDNGSRVRDQFGLPAVVSLILLHGGFGFGVPVTRCIAGEIAGLDKRCLDLGSASVVDGALTCRPNRSLRFGASTKHLRGGWTAMGVGERKARKCRCQDQSRTEKGSTKPHSWTLPWVEYRQPSVDGLARVPREHPRAQAHRV